MKQLTLLDKMLLLSETREVPMHVGGLAACFSLMKHNARIQFESKNPSTDRRGLSDGLLRSLRERYFG